MISQKAIERSGLLYPCHAASSALEYEQNVAGIIKGRSEAYTRCQRKAANGRPRTTA